MKHAHEYFKPIERSVTYEVGLFKVTFKTYGSTKMSDEDRLRAKQIIVEMEGETISAIRRKVHAETSLYVTITLNRFILVR